MAEADIDMTKTSESLDAPQGGPDSRDHLTFARFSPLATTLSPGSVGNYDLNPFYGGIMIAGTMML